VSSELPNGRETMTASEPRLLDRVDFPTNRVELLSRAERVNAPDALKVALRGLPNSTFRTRHELREAIEQLSSR
jgi:hypothetical protein